MRVNIDNSMKSFLTDNGDQIYTTGLPRGPYHIFSDMGYRQMPVNEKVVSIKEKFFEHYEVVENIVYFEHSRVSKSFFAYQQAYKSKLHDYFVLVSPDISDDESASDYKFEDGHFDLNYIYFDGTDFSSCTEAVAELNSCFIHKKENDAVIFIVVKTMNGFEFKRKKIKPLTVDVDKMYNDDFAPIYENIVDKLNNTNKGIVLFHGAAGTGKTNLIKHLTTEVPDKKFVYITQGLLPMLDDPAFIGGLIDNRGSILVIEDCENYLKDREDGGNSVVSSLLNLSDGFLSDVLGLQIIATFNADIKQVDKALLRKGRLIAEYDFNALEVEKAQAIADENDLNFTVKKPMTIAEVFNHKDGSTRSQKERRAIGFGR
jgi:ATPases of the AAA+ class